MKYFFSVDDLNVTLSDKRFTQRNNRDRFVEGNDKNDYIGGLPETIP